MYKFLFIVYLLSFSINSYSQNEILSDNSLTGLYSNNNLSLNISGLNNISIKRKSLESSTNYYIRYSENKIVSNELNQKVNISYVKNKHNYFITYHYNHSLLRNVKSDNYLGIGYGLKYPIKFFKISISYALLYQRLYSYEVINIMRHSTRVKIRFDKKLINVSSEVYIQPDINFKSINIMESSKIGINASKFISFTIQDTYNFYTDSKTIHNIFFGISYKFSKKY